MKDAFVEIARVIGDEADAGEAGEVVDFFEHVGEGESFVVILIFVGVDRLAEQGDFPDAVFGELAAFVNDVFDGSGAFAATDVGDDAIAAEVVAAAHDANVSHEGDGGIVMPSGVVEVFQFFVFGGIVETKQALTLVLDIGDHFA